MCHQGLLHVVEWVFSGVAGLGAEKVTQGGFRVIHEFQWWMGLQTRGLGPATMMVGVAR